MAPVGKTGLSPPKNLKIVIRKNPQDRKIWAVSLTTPISTKGKKTKGLTLMDNLHNDALGLTKCT